MAITTTQGGRSRTGRGVQPTARSKNGWRAHGSSRTTFQCGHSGFGAYCHRCTQADDLTAQVESGTLVEFKRPEPGAKKVRIERKASKQEIATMTQRVLLLRAKPGEKIAPPPKPKPEPKVEVKPVEKPKPTIESVQKKFENYGAVSAATLKAQQRQKVKK